MITAYPIANRRYLDTLTKKQLLAHFDYYVKPMFTERPALLNCLYEPKTYWTKLAIVQAVVDACATLLHLVDFDGVCYYFPVIIRPIGLYYFHHKGYTSSLNTLAPSDVVKFNWFHEADRYAPFYRDNKVPHYPTHIIMACDITGHLGHLRAA